jgi:hypothetical protein
LWPTGTYATGALEAIRDGNIKRLILPHIERSPIRELAKLTGNEPQDIAKDIIRTSRKALEKRKEQDDKQDMAIRDRIELRWYPGIIASSIMIGNPEPLAEESWLQVENLIPLQTGNRSSYALTYGACETAFRTLFINVKKDYERLWSQSLSITEEDLQSAMPEGAL